MNPPPGYALLSELGWGTTGIVYKARCLSLDRVVAIKLPHPCAKAERPARDWRFLRECQAVASLQHPGVVPLYEVGEYQGPYLVRQFVAGDTLGALATARSLDLRTGLRILHQVAAAVGHVHERGFAHRNLRPSNVLIDREGRVGLIGFGRVGLLAGSPRLPRGEEGTEPQVDAGGLQEMLRWLAAILGISLPSDLSRLCATCATVTPATLADALRGHF